MEKEFKDKENAVNVMTVPGKERRLCKREVLTPSWKKAVVSLKPEDKIEFFESL